MWLTPSSTARPDYRGGVLGGCRLYELHRTVADAGHGHRASEPGPPGLGLPAMVLCHETLD